MEGSGSGLFPQIVPRCEEPIENLHVSCKTDENSGGTVQNPDWDVMKGVEIYVRTKEENVTMSFNVSQGMPIDFNITNNGSIETQLQREIGSSKLLKFIITN